MEANISRTSALIAPPPGAAEPVATARARQPDPRLPPPILRGWPRRRACAGRAAAAAQIAGEGGRSAGRARLFEAARPPRAPADRLAPAPRCPRPVRGRPPLRGAGALLG